MKYIFDELRRSGQFVRQRPRRRRSLGLSELRGLRVVFQKFDPYECFDPGP